MYYPVGLQVERTTYVLYIQYCAAGTTGVYY